MLHVAPHAVHISMLGPPVYDNCSAFANPFV